LFIFNLNPDPEFDTTPSARFSGMPETRKWQTCAQPAKRIFLTPAIEDRQTRGQNPDRFNHLACAFDCEKNSSSGLRFKNDAGIHQGQTVAPAFFLALPSAGKEASSVGCSI